MTPVTTTSETDAPSPRITGDAWGWINVEGHGSFKDVKLFPGGAREWDWDETGTRHSPGIQPSDVDELLANGARSVVLGIGRKGRLNVQPETLKALKKEGVSVQVLRTPAAIEHYNELRTNGPVGALIHSTC